MIEQWICRAERPIQQADLLSLTHLYQPLVGPKAIVLYLTLSNQFCAQPNDHLKLQSNQRLLNLLSFSKEELVKARYRLEGIGLLNTYQVVDEKDRRYIEYELVPPLTPKKFFQSDVLCMALYHQIGKEEFISIREELLPSLGGLKKKRVDITKSYQEVFDSISPKEMAQYAKLEKEQLWSELEVEESNDEGKYPKWNANSLTAVRLQLGPWIDEESWTQELEQELNEIKYLYQLDDWGLVKALQNPEVTRHGKIDISRLKKFVREEYQHRFGFGKNQVERQHQDDSQRVEHTDREPLTEEEKHFQQLAQISPIELLDFYQDGGKIPDSDLELVESLMHDYGLPPGVINVLLEYVLLKYDYKLPKALVEKIAGHWKRLRIQTVQEAWEQAKKEDWEGRRKGQKKGKIKKNTQSQPIPQAVVEQMQREQVVEQKENQQDWLETQARINEKIALLERRKKRV